MTETVNKKTRVLVGMSGGVDSTYTAQTLINQGYEVFGCYMMMFEDKEFHDNNIAKVKKVSEFLGIEYIAVDLSKDFKTEVYDKFVDGYKAGQTPNPCALCNRNIKFAKMLQLADENNCEFVATGHYIKTDGEFFYQADDNTKDQSYFLFYVRKEYLKRLIFPMGDKIKADIKETIKLIDSIKQIGEQKESQEICFVDKDYRDILRRHMNIDIEGDIVDSEGTPVGKHRGYMHYTIGQRRGFTLTQPPEGPRYVLKILPDTNQIMVGTKDELDSLEFEIKSFNFFIPQEDFEAEVKIRYTSKKIPCRVRFDGEKAFVHLKEEASAVASGQAAVFYENDKLLGGGWIV